MDKKELLDFLEQGLKILRDAVCRTEDKLVTWSLGKYTIPPEISLSEEDKRHLKICSHTIDDIDKALKNQRYYGCYELEIFKDKLVFCLENEAYPFLSSEDYNKKDKLFAEAGIEDDIRER